MATAGKLGDYLRARREQVHPGDVGLPPGARRRVPGLRREEVALLAGISADYYLRLEQGRDRHPSGQVLDSIARALRLDIDAKRYLHDLARPVSQAKRRPNRPGRVSAGVQSLIASWTGTAALVHGRTMLTLAANPLATALCPYYVPGVNSLRAAFLEPEMRELFVGWEDVTAKTVAYLRLLAHLATDYGRAEPI